jgi:hypothetical protein
MKQEQEQEKTPPYYSVKLETLKSWKSKGIGASYREILAYRIGVTSSSTSKGWHLSNKEVAKLFNVSEDTVERAWAVAEKAGLLPPSTRSSAGSPTRSSAEVNPQFCGNEPAVLRKPTRSSAGSNPQFCGKDDPNFIGETESLSKDKENINSNSNESVSKEQTDGFDEIYESMFKNYNKDKPKETAEVKKSSNVSQNIKTEPEPESHDAIMKKRKVIKYAQSKQNQSSHTAKTNAEKKNGYVYVGIAGTDRYVGIPQTDYDLAEKEMDV